jgi:hypothetical protein
MIRVLVVVCVLASTSALRFGASPLSLQHRRVVRANTPHLQEKLSDEQIKATADAASGETSWPEQKPIVPTIPRVDESVSKEEADPLRLILYVSLPALVLIGQLFFTFSRDMLGDAALSPADMDGAPVMSRSAPAPVEPSVE